MLVNLSKDYMVQDYDSGSPIKPKICDHCNSLIEVDYYNIPAFDCQKCNRSYCESCYKKVKLGKKINEDDGHFHTEKCRYCTGELIKITYDELFKFALKKLKIKKKDLIEELSKIKKLKGI